MEYAGLGFVLLLPSQNNTLHPTPERASNVSARGLLARPLRKEVQEWNSMQKRLETASCLRRF